MSMKGPSSPPSPATQRTYHPESMEALAASDKALADVLGGSSSWDEYAISLTFRPDGVLGEDAPWSARDAIKACRDLLQGYYDISSTAGCFEFKETDKIGELKVVFTRSVDDDFDCLVKNFPKETPTQAVIKQLAAELKEAGQGAGELLNGPLKGIVQALDNAQCAVYPVAPDVSRGVGAAATDAATSEVAPIVEILENGIPNYDNPAVLAKARVQAEAHDEHFSEILYHKVFGDGRRVKNLWNDGEKEETLAAAAGLRGWVCSEECDIPFEIALEMTEHNLSGVRCEGFKALLAYWRPRANPKGDTHLGAREVLALATRGDNADVAVEALAWHSKEFNVPAVTTFRQGLTELAWGDDFLDNPGEPAYLFLGAKRMVEVSKSLGYAYNRFMHDLQLGVEPLGEDFSEDERAEFDRRPTFSATDWFDVATKKWPGDQCDNSDARVDALGRISSGVLASEREALVTKLKAMSLLDGDPWVRAKASCVMSELATGKIRVINKE